MGPRAYLYVPGQRPERFDKALGSGADAIIVDLEDAVPLEAKDAARRDVVAFVSELVREPVEVWVRINDGSRGRDDLSALADATALAGVVVPKAHPATLMELHADAPHVALLPLVETAFGLQAVSDIAGVEGVYALAIGEVDLGADLGFSDRVPEPALWALRMQLVVASGAAAIAAPLGPVARTIDDLDGLGHAVRQLRHAGFGAVQAIHPKQVPIIKAVFTPTASERDAAAQILRLAAASTDGAFVAADGRMIDEAVLRSARALLAVNDHQTS